jgi:hypothetical protein
MTQTLSNSQDHLSWDFILILLFLSLVYYIIGWCSSNGLFDMFCFGCAMGILQCLVIHEGGLYAISFMENYPDFSRLFEHIQLAPFIPQIISGSDTDDDGENEKED